MSSLPIGRRRQGLSLLGLHETFRQTLRKWPGMPAGWGGWGLAVGPVPGGSDSRRGLARPGRGGWCLAVRGEGLPGARWVVQGLVRSVPVVGQYRLLASPEGCA